MPRDAMTESVKTFNCEGDDLLGLLHLPDTDPRQLGVVIVVGGPQYRVGSHRQFVILARRLAIAGHAVLRFDYRGMGDSQGEKRNFESIDADIRSAVDALIREATFVKRVALVGLCDAASAAVLYPSSDRRVSDLVLMNPWVRTEGGAAKAILENYYGQRFLQPAFWRKVLTGGFNPLSSLRDLGRNVFRTYASRPASDSYIDRMTSAIDRDNRPALLLLSGRDLTAREFEAFAAETPAWRKWLSRSNTRIVNLPEADHTLTGRLVQAKADEEILAWLDRAERR